MQLIIGRFLPLMLLLASAGGTIAAPPPNDFFSAAQSLGSQSNLTVQGTTFEATGEPGDPEETRPRTVWYSWTAPSSAQVSLSAISEDDPLACYLAYGDSALASKVMKRSVFSITPLSFYAVAGRTYRFCVDDYVPGYISYEGYGFTFGLAVQSALPTGTLFLPPLQNDDFADANAVTGGSWNLALSTRGATFEPFEQEMLRSVPGLRFSTIKDGGVWIKWQAPSNGTAAFSARTPESGDVILIAAEGSSIPELEGLAGKNGLLFDCTQGTTYRLYLLSQDDSQVLASLQVTGNGPGGGGVVDLGARAGAFRGRLGKSGAISLTLTRSGSITGKVLLEGKTTSFSGNFDSTGKANVPFGPANLPMLLSIDPAGSVTPLGDIALTGTLSGESFTAYHAAYESGAATTETGKYTLLLKPQSVSPNLPQGIGYAAVTAKAGGAITLSGKLADGSPASVGGPLVGDGTGGRQLLFSLPLYGKKGALAGGLRFRAETSTAIDGSLDWSKPPRPTDRYYFSGFTAITGARGARYAAPSAGTVAIGLSGGKFRASDSGFSPGLSNPFTLSTVNLVTIAGANPELIKVKLTPSSGLFSGSFLRPGSTRAISFRGLLYQHPGAPQAGGYYLTPAVEGDAFSGGVSLLP